MADRGFTIQDQLQNIAVVLNIPPFLDGKQQLSVSEVQQGRSIASLRIHVERAIGCLKNFTILKEVFSLKMARLVNQIIFVCAMLTNFFSPLVPPFIDRNEELDLCSLESSDTEDSDTVS